MSFAGIVQNGVVILDNGHHLPDGTRVEVIVRDGPFPAVNSEAWGKMNCRRAELIAKKNRQSLTSEEQAEFERLQRLSQAELERAFPAPRDDERLKAVEARLDARPEA